ncbi:hypothetical protein Verru16b_01610 [Lacunisphaera limnophila]|uniref:Glycosyltransferase RgtA/B/C/D-like domain-containing protein n=1 Tax=Lacunisphaera limnophila TaxID=1838286 RepID=A0A1D8AUI6_9BACT|nr:hypothetical protein [Lacunisphaera limnophila]AOS44547.1 hypothetical protein Verru16b_01610 [Lacunisphaera limnophila]
MSVRPSLSLALLAAGAAALVVLLFAAGTGHVWEDFYITFRSSLHLAQGDGLVFQPGERVHSFTSPLGTLLPALFALGGGADPAAQALWLFRLVSAAALGGAVARLVQEGRRADLSVPALAAAAGFLVLDPKIVDFSGNGMESAWMVLFAVLTWSALLQRRSVLALAGGYAGLQWTRPDGFIVCLALTVAWFTFGRERKDATWREDLTYLARAVLLGALFYLPWLIGSWAYFGSPVPHTILAKSGLEVQSSPVVALLFYPWRLLFGEVALHDLFMPSYYYLGGWPAFVPWLARLLAVPAALAWVLPGVRPGGRVASAALFLGGFYLELIPRSPWYFPVWQALACVSWAWLLDLAWRHTATAAPAWRLLGRCTRITAASLFVFQAGMLVAVGWQMRTQQRLIEHDHRRELGLWLRDQAAPGDRVFLEPLGYIGYFSGLKMLDFPGLASPEVVTAWRDGHTSYARLIRHLEPQWLVLRPDQVGTVQLSDPGLLGRTYRLVRTFDVRPSVDSVPVLPGRGYLQFDAVYHVFSRREGAMVSAGIQP